MKGRRFWGVLCRLLRRPGGILPAALGSGLDNKPSWASLLLCLATLTLPICSEDSSPEE